MQLWLVEHLFHHKRVPVVLQVAFCDEKTLVLQVPFCDEKSVQLVRVASFQSDFL